MAQTVLNCPDQKEIDHQRFKELAFAEVSVHSHPLTRWVRFLSFA